MTVDSNMKVEKVQKDGDHEDVDLGSCVWCCPRAEGSQTGEAQGDPVHQRQEGLEVDPSTRSSTPRVPFAQELLHAVFFSQQLIRDFIAVGVAARNYFQLQLQPRSLHGIIFQFRLQPRSRYEKTVSNDNIR